MTTEITESKNYLQTLEDIKQRVKTAQIKAHLSVNREMIILYWQNSEYFLFVDSSYYGWDGRIRTYA